MQSEQKRARIRIEVALFHSRNPFPQALGDALPFIEDWCAVVDHDVPHIHGTVVYPMQQPRPILTAAVIGIETMPVLMIRCLDGCYRLGQPSRTESGLPRVGKDPGKRQVSWSGFRVLVAAFLDELNGGTEDT